MKPQPLFDKIDLQLIRTLHTLLIERSVSRAALRLGQQQPAVSVALRRLRALTGDAILVRSGTGMVPTDTALRMLEPLQALLDSAQQVFQPAPVFDPAHSTERFRIAASDTLDPLFLPSLVCHLQRLAPQVQLEVHSLSAQARYAQDLADGTLDVVVGNWARPSEGLHRAPLLEDEVASLVSQQHPAVRRGWRPEDWLACQHLAPTPHYPGWRGFVDEHLDSLGLRRSIAVRCAHFGQMPRMVASSLLVLTTGRQYGQRFVHGPLAIPGLVLLPTPLPFPPMKYYQLWHERSHHASAQQWLRERIRETAQALPPPQELA